MHTNTPLYLHAWVKIWKKGVPNRTYVRMESTASNSCSRQRRRRRRRRRTSFWNFHDYESRVDISRRVHHKRTTHERFINMYTHTTYTFLFVMVICACAGSHNVGCARCGDGIMSIEVRLCIRGPVTRLWTTIHLLKATIWWTKSTLAPHTTPHSDDEIYARREDGPDKR